MKVYREGGSLHYNNNAMGNLMNNISVNISLYICISFNKDTVMQRIEPAWGQSTRAQIFGSARLNFDFGSPFSKFNPCRTRLLLLKIIFVKE